MIQPFSPFPLLPLPISEATPCAACGSRDNLGFHYFHFLSQKRPPVPLVAAGITSVSITSTSYLRSDFLKRLER